MLLAVWFVVGFGGRVRGRVEDRGWVIK